VFGPPRAGDIRESVSDSGAIERLLGFKPRVELRQGLLDTLAWYRAAA
jgi:nucleoside-diphosphate-sugar epimerase